MKKVKIRLRIGNLKKNFRLRRYLRRPAGFKLLIRLSVGGGARRAPPASRRKRITFVVGSSRQFRLGGDLRRTIGTRHPTASNEYKLLKVFCNVNVEWKEKINLYPP